MQGAPKRQVNAQVNAEDMLAELKRALESSTPAADAPPPAASTTPKTRSPKPGSPKASSPSQEARRSRIDRGSDGPGRTIRRSFRSWELIAGGLALVGAAAVCVSVVLTNKAPDLAEREPPVAATESLATPQSEQTPEPSSAPRLAAPAFAPGPLNEAPTLVTSHRIGPDGRRLRQRRPRLLRPFLTDAPQTAAPRQPRRPSGRTGPSCDSAARSRLARFDAASG